jgi:hypothetical protein
VRKRVLNLIYIILIVVITIGSYKYGRRHFLKPDFDIPVQCTNNQKERVWLVSYADGDAYIANQKFQTYSAINKCVDFFLPYSFKDLGEDFKERNKSLLAKPRGAGYWVWKPYLILKTLEMIPENDIVMYVDSSAFINRPVDTLINEYLSKADISITLTEHLNKYWVKRDVLRALGLDNQQIRDSKHLQGGYIIARNTDFTKNFIKSWLGWCEKEELIDDSPSENEYPEFKDNRHDQALLTMLYYQNKTTKNADKISIMLSSEVELWNMHQDKNEKSYFINTRRKNTKTPYQYYINRFGN